MPVLSLVYDVQLVRDVRRTDGGVRLTLGDGRPVFLDKNHLDFDAWLIQVESKLRDVYPVGVVTDECGRVLDLNTAHDTGVAWVCEFPTDPNRYRVAFWAYSPVCGLTRDQPGFDRIYSTLSAAAGTQERMWIVAHTEETVDDEPDEDGLVAALPRVMDVKRI